MKELVWAVCRLTGVGRSFFAAPRKLACFCLQVMLNFIEQPRLLVHVCLVNIPYFIGRPDWETLCISLRNVQNKCMY